ncbi:MAG: Vitamin B12 dependent methionine synthase activation subunit [Clostridia bacterium]|nr:Vitamin B12 dependent methionine synthase activation subunit [Clostridia bacterium]
MSALTTVDRAEVYRYLGGKGDVDDTLRSLVETAVQRIDNAAQPRAILKETALTVQDDTVCLGAWAVHSADLARHLRGCRRAYLLATTLGADVDRLLSRDSVATPSLAVTEQAVAAAMIEKYCDDETARQIPLAQTEALCDRFSPGYGDFSLTYQEELLRLLDAQKRIGLTATDTCMLTPMKSVTAVIGIADGAERCATSRCARCTKRDCAFRKDEETP